MTQKEKVAMIEALVEFLRKRMIEQDSSLEGRLHHSIYQAAKVVTQAIAILASKDTTP